MKSKIKSFSKVISAGENHSTKAHSGAYLTISLISMATAFGFKFLRRKHPAFIIGEWVAPFLIMALYDKIKKGK